MLTAEEGIFFALILLPFLATGALYWTIFFTFLAVQKLWKFILVKFK
jgi:hypothetical protein